VAFALSLQAALAQKASASSPTGASSAKTNATTGSAPAGGGGASNGSSSWIAGGESFGSKKAESTAIWGSGRAASSESSSWTAGKGSFQYARQPDGVWLEGSAQYATASKASPNGAVLGALPPSRSPAPVHLKTAAPSTRIGGASGKAQVARASTGPRNGAASKSRVGAFKSPRAKYSTPRVRSQSGSKSGANAGKETDTGSGLGSTLPSAPALK
jgi:hypothetical protein